MVFYFWLWYYIFNNYFRFGCASSSRGNLTAPATAQEFCMSLQKLRLYGFIFGILTIIAVGSAHSETKPLIDPVQFQALNKNQTGPVLDLERTRQRQLFSTSGDTKRGVSPFKDVDLSDEIDKEYNVIKQLTDDQQAIINNLSDPFFLRRLKDEQIKGVSRASEEMATTSSKSIKIPTTGPERSTQFPVKSTRDLPWSPDQLLANPTNMNDEYISLAESPITGHLYAVFAAKDLGGTDRDIHIAQSTNGGENWTVWEMPSFSQDEFHPELAIDGGGYIHVTWIRDDGYILRSRTSYPDDPTEWDGIRGLGTDEQCAMPAIAVSGAGDFSTIFIAANWLTINYDLYQYEWTLIFMYSTNGGQTVTYDYFLPDGYTDLWPDVAMNNGTVHFVNAEVDYYTGETDILVATDAFNGSFADPGNLTGFTSDNCGFPSVACQDDDVFIVFQLDYTDGMTTNGDIIYTYSWDIGATFFGPYGMVADDYESVGPTIFTRNGVVGAMWLDAPANADEFYLASRLGAGYGNTSFLGSVELVSEQPRVEPQYHSAFGAATGNKIHASWIDRRDYATQGHNVYTSRRDVAPNLVDFTPADWDTSLIASMVRGGRTDNYLCAGDTTFISFAFVNDGLADITGSFGFSLLLDDIPLAAWDVDGGLSTGNYVAIEDFPVLVGEGPHTLQVIIDDGHVISESNETDNIFERQFTWILGDPELRFNPTHLTKTIVPETSRRSVLDLINNPVLRHEVHVPVISKNLSQAMAGGSRSDMLRVMIVPARRIDPNLMSAALKGATRATKREVVTKAARQHMDKTFADLSPLLNQLAAQGKGTEPQPLWLPGMIAMTMTPSAIEELAANPAVGYLWLDNVKSETFGGPDGSKPSVKSEIKANAAHIATTGADQIWARGFTGAGIVVGHIDTGIAYDHPDMVNQMWDGGSEFPNHGWDSVSDDNDPYDGDVDWHHGTHTGGIIVGDGTSGTATGIAPDATIMALRALPGYFDDMIEALQFGLDNGVHLFSLSGGWSMASDEIRSANRYNAELLLSIDVPWVCSAGNGDNVGGHNDIPFDIVSPGDSPGPWYAPSGNHTAAVAVGALEPDNTIWPYSSIGPTQWDMDNSNSEVDYHDYPYTPGLIKPDIAAPGGNITSCSGNSGYVVYSGTSMACPMVTGAYCLIWSAVPGLLVPQVAEIMETTATDMVLSPASVGRDNYTGAGLLNLPDCFEAMPTGEPGLFWVHNDGSLPLIISSITEDASWLKIALPETTIAPGDSLQLTAMFDPEGLAEGYYSTTAVFVTNDPGSPNNLPISLIYGDGASAVDDNVAPVLPGLLQAYPNPFNPRTVIAFTMDSNEAVQLDVFDMRGRLVRCLLRDILPAGGHEIIWDGTDESGRGMASGTYFARLKQGSSAALTRKLTLVR